MTKCTICNMEMSPQVEDYHYVESGRDDIILKNLTVFRCNECGNSMPQMPNIVSLHRLMKKIEYGEDKKFLEFIDGWRRWV